MIRLFATALLLTALCACAPRFMAVGDPVYDARLERRPAADAGAVAVMPDGAALPMRIFAAERPRAVIVALHGFNDYSAAFAAPGPGPWFAARGVTLYAFDQRGFGRAPGHGLWAGDDRMAEDAAAMVGLVRARHPGLPVYLLGTSMGGAVAMQTMTLPDPPRIDGLILAAPAVWGWREMNGLYGAALWTAAHMAPSVTLTGRGLGILPSDNIDMLRALGRDPLVIKETRIDTIYGLVGLMDKAFAAAPRLGVPVLLLYGAKDRIVPARPMADAFAAMQRAHVNVTALCYRGGYHMLLRDLGREAVWRDMAGWIAASGALAPGVFAPSGSSRLSACGGSAKGG